MDKKTLVDVFVKAGLIGQDERQKLLDANKAAGEESIEDTLVRLNYADEEEVTRTLAEHLGIGDGSWATAETRRGRLTLRARVVATIRPDTIFVPYHWPGRRSVNRLTIAAQDPISKIPEYKVCAVRVAKASEPPDYAREGPKS